MLDSTVGKPGKYGRGRGAIATPSLENLPRLVWPILLLPSIANNAERLEVTLEPLEPVLVLQDPGLQKVGGGAM